MSDGDGRTMNYLSLHADVRALSLIVEALLVATCSEGPDPALALQRVGEEVSAGVEAWKFDQASGTVEERLRGRLRLAASGVLSRAEDRLRRLGLGGAASSPPIDESSGG